MALHRRIGVFSWSLSNKSFDHFKRPSRKDQTIFPLKFNKKVSIYHLNYKVLEFEQEQLS